jgi:hypothetical protein
MLTETMTPVADASRHATLRSLNPRRKAGAGMEDRALARENAPARYWLRRQNRSTLYGCVQEHLETWPANAATVTTTVR